MTDALDEINDRHLSPWAQICQKDGIENSPLTPFMDEELLYNKHIFMDNTKLKETGFQLRHPIVKRELIEEVGLELISRLGWFS